jgi:hypothetical protein
MKASYLLLDDTATSGVGHPIVGKLRVMPGGYLGDDTGYRRLLFASDFPYFLLWEIDNAEARRGKQAIARAGYHGSRDLVLIAEDFDEPTPPGTYWYGRSVSKATFRRNAVEALQYSKSLGLRTILSAGHAYKSVDDERAWFAEWTQLLRDGGVADAVAWVETLGNEVSTNRPDIASDVNVAMGRASLLHPMIRGTLGCLVSNGDFGNESTVGNPQYPNEPTLLNSALGADLLDIHNQRQVDFVKHSHTLWLATHYQNADRRPISEGEVGGENDPYPEYQQGGDVYAACNDPHLLLAEIGIQQMTGQASVYLNGPGVRRKYPIDSTLYFNKLPKAVSVIPDDIPTWRDENNPSWFIKGKEFVYVGLVGYGQLANPPHEVAQATFYDMDGVAGEGAGARLVPPVGWTGGIVRGTFV